MKTKLVGGFSTWPRKVNFGSWIADPGRIQLLPDHTRLSPENQDPLRVFFNSTLCLFSVFLFFLRNFTRGRKVVIVLSAFVIRPEC